MSDVTYQRETHTNVNASCHTYESVIPHVAHV